MSAVLVTGGSGFVGSHVILKLLAEGHTVRTTVRSLQREAGTRKQLGAESEKRLSFFAADLVRDDGWAEAVAGCDYVIHVASPLPPSAPKTEDEVIIPAREGALRVLRAARDAKVKRVVLTSSCGAVYYGHPKQTAPFDETSWTNIGGEKMSFYVKSKVLAERAAWDFIAAEGGALELTTICPVGVFGPALGADYAASLDLIARLLKGMRGCPRLLFAIVDVRDVADLHVRAMTDPLAKGERFIAAAEGNAMSMLQVANVLRERLGDAAKKVPTRQLPDWLVRLAARFDPALRQLLPLLGKSRSASGAKARRVLQWSPRSREDAVVATAESLVRLNLAR